jgi:hypothetical protein
MNMADEAPKKPNAKRKGGKRTKAEDKPPRELSREEIEAIREKLRRKYQTGT